MDHRRILEEKILTTTYMDLFNKFDTKDKKYTDDPKHQEIFQKIIEEISCFVKYVPELTKNKELHKGFTNANKVAAIFHNKQNKKNITKLNGKKYYKKGFYDNAKKLLELEGRVFDESNIKILNELVTLQFNKVLEEKAFFLWQASDCETLDKKFSFSFKAALALTYMELVDTVGMQTEMRKWRDKLAIYSCLISAIHKCRWKSSAFDRFITKLPEVKLGLDPEEFHSLSIMYLNKLWCNHEYLKDDVDMKSRLRRRVQTCLKNHLPRQNISTERMDSRRSGGKTAYSAYCEYLEVDKSLTPYKMNKASGDGTSINRNAAYHNDAIKLYIDANVLTDDYHVNDKGFLTIKGKKACHESYLIFLENWILCKLKFLRSFKPIKNPDEDKETDQLTLAFRSLFGRYCNEMSIANNLDIEEAGKKWQKHIDIICAFSVLVAVFDELCHLQYGEKECGIKKCVSNNLRLKNQSDKPVISTNEREVSQIWYMYMYGVYGIFVLSFAVLVYFFSR